MSYFCPLENSSTKIKSLKYSALQDHFVIYVGITWEENSFVSDYSDWPNAHEENSFMYISTTIKI